MPTARRRTARRRNPDAAALIAEAEAIPMLSAAELRALSDDALHEYAMLLGTMQEELRRAAVSAERSDYARIGRALAALRHPSLAQSDEWYARAAAKKKAAKEARQAKAAAKALADTTAGLAVSPYFPTKAKMGAKVNFPDRYGDLLMFKVMGLASGSDPGNASYLAALIADGVRDKRNHRGDWAVIERGSDAAIVSIGKGPKRNPRRRRAPARRYR